ncbi:hypothetical protein NR402_07270 [Acidithiobacillus ferrooxidans]|uniref:hypothetical protein n=1 Tax=Acidithiobacillus ferrooxidans TaxID=920 RepID=UPI00214AF6EB|nr:hypothetical protein [Acidithiobacillus ferrooxidans]MCR2830080.1 hypothetical protein [Acidithiobacillus ferrooxidans]
MTSINRIGSVIESMATLRVMLPACVIGLPAGYLSFGSMGMFVVASVLGVVTLAGVLWTAFAPNDPSDHRRLLSSARRADYDREFLDEYGSTKHVLSVPDSPADLVSSEEAARVYEDIKARSLGLSVVIGSCDPSGFKVSPERTEKLKITTNTAIRGRTEDRES